MEILEVHWVDGNNQEQSKVFKRQRDHIKAHEFYVDKLREGASQATIKTVVSTMVNAKDLAVEDCFEKLKHGHTLFVNESSKMKKLRELLRPLAEQREIAYAVTRFGNFSDESKGYWVVFFE